MDGEDRIAISALGVLDRSGSRGDGSRRLLEALTEVLGRWRSRRGGHGQLSQTETLVGQPASAGAHALLHRCQPRAATWPNVVTMGATATAYLTGFGRYLPGDPVDNDGIAARLGGDDRRHRAHPPPRPRRERHPAAALRARRARRADRAQRGARRQGASRGPRRSRDRRRRRADAGVRDDDGRRARARASRRWCTVVSAADRCSCCRRRACAHPASPRSMRP